MSTLIDISVLTREGMPIWPGSSGYRHLWESRIGAAGATANGSRIETDVHVGTHVDAPLHFIPGGASIEHLPLAAMIGPAYVADLRMTSQITADTLSNARIPAGTVRLLLHTTNSERWSRDLPFTPDFVALSPSAAAWIVDHEIALLGVDYLSVQRFRDGPETHQILLDAGVVIVEGLDLSQPEAGEYELIVLPIKLAGAEGAPARAVIRR